MTDFIPTRLLSVSEVIARRGCSRSSFYVELQTDPAIPRPVKLGRRTLFVEQEIEAWLSRTVEQARACN